MDQKNPLIPHEETAAALKRTEIGLISLLWAILLVTPLLFSSGEDAPSFYGLLKLGETIIPLFLVFLVNRFVLFRLFFQTNRKTVYFLAVMGVIVGLTSLSFVYHKNRPVPPPHEHSYQPNHQPNEARKSILPKQPPRPESLPPYMHFFLLAVLVVGFDTGLKSTLRNISLEKEKEALEKAHIESQLNHLKNQISPHFFLNTLNNIHALMELSKEMAEDAIIRLSDLMRYLLYDSNQAWVPLEMEKTFIENYFSLMRMRISEKVSFQVEISLLDERRQIPPLLFLALIENAFKHGVSYLEPSYIHFRWQTDETHSFIEIENSLHPAKSSSKASGIGLENTQNRLKYLFHSDYDFLAEERKDSYFVRLKIPLQ